MEIMLKKSEEQWKWLSDLSDSISKLNKNFEIEKYIQLKVIFVKNNEYIINPILLEVIKCLQGIHDVYLLRESNKYILCISEKHILCKKSLISRLKKSFKKYALRKYNRYMIKLYYLSKDDWKNIIDNMDIFRIYN